MTFVMRMRTVQIQLEATFVLASPDSLEMGNSAQVIMIKAHDNRVGTLFFHRDRDLKPAVHSHRDRILTRKVFFSKNDQKLMKYRFWDNEVFRIQVSY